MKYCVIFGSPRKSGNTAALLGIVEEELRGAGEEISRFDVYDKEIAGCRACLACQRNEGEICCSIQDDMQPILREVQRSDAIIIAAPVYVWSAPAPAKAVIDRLVYSACKYYGERPDGPSLLEDKRLALIASCGYPIERGADLYEEAMKRYCRHSRMRYAGMLCERHRNLKEPFMDGRKEAHAREFAASLRG